MTDTLSCNFLKIATVLSMGFDMYLNGIKESIDHSEEELFYKVNEDERFPRLNWIWENFYNGPKISPEVANDLVHELILLKVISDEKSVHHVIEKLIPFFSKAHQSKSSIKTQSD